MKRINSLSDFLMEELAELLNAENQLVETLPKMAEASQLPALKSFLEECHGITRDHINQLQGIFNNIGQTPHGVVSQVIKGFVGEFEGTVKKTEKSTLRDAVIINVLQRAQEYEIAAYKRAREHAADLGHTKIVELFTKTLNEERNMNFHLNELAQGIINVQALDTKGPDRQEKQQQGTSPKSEKGGFYIPEGNFDRRSAIKKKPKNTDLSRFISEGNPNTQDQNLQNPEEPGNIA